MINFAVNDKKQRFQLKETTTTTTSTATFAFEAFIHRKLCLLGFFQAIMFVNGNVRHNAAAAADLVIET